MHRLARRHRIPQRRVGVVDRGHGQGAEHVVDAAIAGGAEVIGYTGQAQFLINCGITDLLAAVSPEDSASYLPLAAQAQTLMSPAEMGELFKVIAFARGLDLPWLGFARGDKGHTL